MAVLASGFRDFLTAFYGVGIILRSAEYLRELGKGDSGDVELREGWEYWMRDHFC